MGVILGYNGKMAKKMETIGIIGFILGLDWDNGKKWRLLFRV